MLLLLLGATTSASAQEPERPTPTAITQFVYVHTEGSWNEVKGRILRLDSTDLTLLVGDQELHIPWTGVAKIDVPGDPVSDGAAKGGVVVAVMCAIFCGQGSTSMRHFVTLMITQTAYGAVFGAGIDAMHKGRETIYERPTSRAVLSNGLSFRVTF